MMAQMMSYRILALTCIFFLALLITKYHATLVSLQNYTHPMSAAVISIPLKASNVTNSTSSVPVTISLDTPPIIAQKESTTAGQGRGLDIVVSYYSEELDKVKQNLKRILQRPKIRSRSPRILFYNKNPKVKAEYLNDYFNMTNLVVVQTPNEGREGGTYLRYIIDNYDTLPRHTLFTQAFPHDLTEFLWKIDQFFVEDTGALSLGFYLPSECKVPRDGINDYTWNYIPEIYALSHGELCPTSGLLLTFQGQVIASGQNIRKTPKATYEHLAHKLTHSMGTEQLPGWQEVDTVDNPFWGHTLERSWMILFHCVKPELVESCAKASEGKEKIVNLEACQCMTDS